MDALTNYRYLCSHLGLQDSLILYWFCWIDCADRNFSRYRCVLWPNKLEPSKTQCHSITVCPSTSSWSIWYGNIAWIKPQRWAQQTGKIWHYMQKGSRSSLPAGNIWLVILICFLIWKWLASSYSSTNYRTLVFVSCLPELCLLLLCMTILVFLTR